MFRYFTNCLWLKSVPIWSHHATQSLFVTPFKLLRALAFRLLAFGLRHLAGTRTSHCFTQDPSPFLTPDLHPYTNHSLSLIRYMTLHVTSSRLFLPRTLREDPGPGSTRPHRAMRDWTVPHARSRHISRPLHATHRPAAPHTCTHLTVPPANKSTRYTVAIPTPRCAIRCSSSATHAHTVPHSSR